MEEELTNIKANYLLKDARSIIEAARNNAVRSVNFSRVQMYWNLGRRIFEEEQQGKERAEYGAYIIEMLAKNLDFIYIIRLSAKGTNGVMKPEAGLSLSLLFCYSSVCKTDTLQNTWR